MQITYCVIPFIWSSKTGKTCPWDKSQDCSQPWEILVGKLYKEALVVLEILYNLIWNKEFICKKSVALKL